MFIVIATLAMFGAPAYLWTAPIADRKAAHGNRLLRFKEYAAALNYYYAQLTENEPKNARARYRLCCSKFVQKSTER